MIDWPFAIPLLVIGVTVALYWYQVLHMARRQRKRSGKAANLIPPEPLGRVLRMLWGPVVVIWMAHPLASAFIAQPPAVVRPLFETAWLMWIAAAVVVAGLLVTRRCWKRMGKSWRMGIDPREKTSLVLNGLFGYVRHPIYAVSAGMMSATVLALPTPLMLISGTLHITLLLCESAREEQHLLAVHGEAYQAYQRRVGRLLPRSLRRYGGS